MQEAKAAGFFVQEQSVTGVGRANAGVAAMASDPSTIFYNPAGMTDLAGPVVAAAGHLIMPRARLENRGSTASGPLTGGAVAYAGTNDDPFSPTPVGNVYAAAPVFGGRGWLGLGVTAPFGLVTEYDETFFGRYDSLKSKLLTIDVAPTAAVAVTKWLSVGFGLDVQWAHAELVNAIPDPLTAGGPTPQTDGRLDLRGDNWGVGYNVGLLVKPLPTTRIGLHYRSAMTHDLEGTATVSGLSGPLAALNNQSGGTAKLKLPDILSLGVSHDITPRLTMLGQVWLYGWNRFDEVRVDLDGGPDDIVMTQNYRNTLATAVGAEYRLNESWTLRGGFQYDQTPTVAEYQSTRVPDGDRYWLAVGSGYRLSDQISLDVAYAHVFIDEHDIDRTDTFYSGTPFPVVTRIRGSTEGGSADILSLQMRVRF